MTERQVEDLVREVVRAINAGATERREQLREMAVHLLRDEVEIAERVIAAPESCRVFNPFGIGIPLVLAGGVMLIVFPPVGLLLFATAGLMMLWGAAAVLVARR